LNAFFSGSVKVEEATDPLRFPANLHKSHGKELNPQNSTFKDIEVDGFEYCMEGYVTK